MSDDIAIRAEGLGKKYIIGHQSERERYTTLRDVVGRTAKGLIRSAKDMVKGKPIVVGDTREEFWAIKDVDFEIKCGEVVGIIGRNGAGKSTLLKLLSRITDPTQGRITIKGRVASLLEVGTGFHPELTGRENVYLNGSILGMSRKEVKRKFDEIVAFAEVERFLDTPVKRYSSGMYVRLAFAVAAHLEPEILVVDEVLAVGDAQFQKKCLQKMEKVGKEGRTVLFVSHNMAAVENLCSTGIVLDHGMKGFQGEVAQAVNKYLNSFVAENTTNLKQRTDRQGKGHVRITQLNIEDKSGNKNVPFPIGSELSFQIHYQAEEEERNPRVIIGLYDNKGVGITRLDTDITGGIQGPIPKDGHIVCTTKEMNLTPGRYFINIAFFSNGEMEDYLIHAAFLDIAGSDFFNTGKIFNESDSSLTKVLVRHDWKVSP
jgi:lipopolysaccharide transport system ATP-binding protein